MAIKALTPGKLIKHVCADDVRPEPIKPTKEVPTPDNSESENWKPTIWKLKCLDSRILGVLKDKVTKLTINPNAPGDDVGTLVNQNQYYFQVVQLALDEPDNFESGVSYGTMKMNIGGKSYVVATPEYVETIPDYVLAELAEVVIDGNSLSDTEGKG